MTAAAGTALRTQVYLSPTRVIAGDRTFSPVSSTLFIGAEEAVLVNAQYHREDVAALGEMVAASGKRLAAIYITHGHSDHYFGAGAIAARFPGARIVALPAVVDYIREHHDSEVQTIRAMFGDRAVTPEALPEAMDAPTIDLEGHALAAIEIGQGDIAPSTALHAAELGVVVPGDIVYNGVHMMVGLGGPDQWSRWIESIDAIAALRPKALIAGHKRAELPDDEPERILDESRSYIRDFTEIATADPSAEAIVERLRGKYPAFGNVTTLMFSAHAAARLLTGRAPPRIA